MKDTFLWLMFIQTVIWSMYVENLCSTYTYHEVVSCPKRVRHSSHHVCF